MDGGFALPADLGGFLPQSILSAHARSAGMVDMLLRYDSAVSETKSKGTQHERSLGAEIFLQMLREYLSGSHCESDFFFRASLPKSETEEAIADKRALSGLVLMVLQEKLPLEILLRDGIL